MGCGETTKDSKGDDSSKNGESTEQITTSLKKQEACSAITTADLVEVLGWSEADIKSDQGRDTKKVSICNLLHQEEKLMVRLGWKSEAAQKNKVLENNFKKYLEKGEGKISYTAIDETTLQGDVEDRGGQHIYMVRKRFGNEAEIQIELVVPAKDDTYQEKLKMLLTKVK